MLSHGLLKADAGEWRRAGSAAKSHAVATATPAFDSLEQLAQQSPRAGVQRTAAVQPRVPAKQFDPFEEPLTDNDAAMPQADGAAADPFDPFDTPAGQSAPRPIPAPAIGPIVAPDAEAAPEIEAAPEPAAELNVVDPVAEEPTQTVGRRPAETFDVQEAFDEPRTAQVRPGIGAESQEELEEASQAVEDEITRRGGRAPVPPEADVANPFRPGDALDAPRRFPGGDVEEAFPDPQAPAESDAPEGETADDEMSAEDLDLQFQQGPGGFQFRQLDQQPSLTPEQQEAQRRMLERERIESEKNCETIVATVKADDIKTVSLDIRTAGEAGEDYPFECGLGQERFKPRSWAQTTYLWKAAGLCHKPLYFEQVQLERYGHTAGPLRQPFISGAHFFVSIAALPYKMAINPPHECQYALGYYRPGSCAPWMIPPVPLSLRGALAETSFILGGIHMIP